MPDFTQDNVATEERLKAALWHSLGKTVDSVAVDQDINTSPQLIAALTELVHMRITQAATDLEAFAKHAGRTTINTDDVMLLTRNNDALRQALQQSLRSAQKASGK